MTHRLALQARTDLEEIWLHVARASGSETVADRLIESITTRFALLAGHPYLGRARDDELGRGRRSFPVGDYVLIYRIVGADVQILRILHGRRNIPALFGR